MPNKIAFKGFRSGSQVTIGGMTVANWGGSIAPTVPEGLTLWDLPASAGTGVKINVRRSPFQLAPEGIEFDLALTGFDTNTPSVYQSYHASFGDKLVWWDYGDGYTFIAPDQIIAWDAADGGDRSNSQYSRGPLGAHVFRTPGDHTIRAFVYEPSSGKIGQGSFTITVGNQDTYYSGSQTIYCASDGDYSRKPDGAQETNSLDMAISLLLGASVPHRIMLKRGLDYTTNGANTSQIQNSYPAGGEFTLRVEAQQGAGDQPRVVVNPTKPDNSDLIYDNARRNIDLNKAEVTFFDIDFRGGWDSLTARGQMINFMFSNGGTYGSEYILIDRCRFNGFRSGYNLSNNTGQTPNRVFFMNDCWFTNWQNICFYGAAQSKLNFIGNGIVQNVDAVQLQVASITLPCIRAESASRLLLNQNDCFFCCGHSFYSGSSMLAVQPALRLFSSPNYLYPQLSMWANVVESGRFAMYIKPFSATAQRYPINAVIEGNFLIAGFQAECVMQICTPGTIRDNQFMFAGNRDSRAAGGKLQPVFGIIELVGGTAGTHETENHTRPLNIYNNTAINLKDAQVPMVFETTSGDGAVDMNWTQANNVLHQTGPSPQSMPYTNMQTVQAVRPRYKGYRPSTSTLYTACATPLTAGQILAPGEASNARGAATGSLVSPLDRFPQVSSDAIIDRQARDVGWAQYRK